MRTPTHVTTTLERYLGLVSERVGVIRSVTRVSRGAEEPSPPILYQAQLAHFDFKNAKPLERAAVGKGATDAEALAGAIGEAVERYSASHPDLKSLRRASLAMVGSPAISPADCVLYSESQYARKGFPYPRCQQDTDIAWLPARELPGDSDVLAPASLIYLNYSGDRPEEYLCPPTSNGLAAGPDLETAILHGLYELVERDGFLITWMNKLPVPEVDFSDSAGIAGSIRTHYRRFGMETRVYNAMTDLPVYVMIGVLVDPSGRGPAAVVGLGAHPDPRVALIKSLYEVCQVHPGEARRHRDLPPGHRLRSHADVRTLEDHSAFHALPEHHEELAFLLDSGRVQRLESLPNHSRGSVRDDLDVCVSSLVRAGCRVVYADITTPDVAPFGLRVVRTLATGLQPIHFGYGEERLGGRRLYEVPQAMGHTRQPTTESDLNPCPHPLA